MILTTAVLAFEVWLKHLKTTEAVDVEDKMQINSSFFLNTFHKYVVKSMHKDKKK
jgi:hypothetical protein